jgi:hypothetical protein
METNKSTNLPDAPAADSAPRRMTFAENAILTLKVVGAFLLLGAGIWGINLWKSTR